MAWNTILNRPLLQDRKIRRLSCGPCSRRCQLTDSRGLKGRHHSLCHLAAVTAQTTSVRDFSTWISHGHPLAAVRPVLNAPALSWLCLAQRASRLFPGSPQCTEGGLSIPEGRASFPETKGKANERRQGAPSAPLSRKAAQP